MSYRVGRNEIVSPQKVESELEPKLQKVKLQGPGGERFVAVLTNKFDLASKFKQAYLDSTISDPSKFLENLIEGLQDEIKEQDSTSEKALTLTMDMVTMRELKKEISEANKFWNMNMKALTEKKENANKVVSDYNKVVNTGEDLVNFMQIFTVWLNNLISGLQLLISYLKESREEFDNGSNRAAESKSDSKNTAKDLGQQNQEVPKRSEVNIKPSPSERFNVKEAIYKSTSGAIPKKSVNDSLNEFEKKVQDKVKCNGLHLGGLYTLKEQIEAISVESGELIQEKEALLDKINVYVIIKKKIGWEVRSDEDLKKIFHESVVEFYSEKPEKSLERLRDTIGLIHEDDMNEETKEKLFQEVQASLKLKT